MDFYLPHSELTGFSLQEMIDNDLRDSLWNSENFISDSDNLDSDLKSFEPIFDLEMEVASEEEKHFDVIDSWINISSTNDLIDPEKSIMVDPSAVLPSSPTGHKQSVKASISNPFIPASSTATSFHKTKESTIVTKSESDLLCLPTMSQDIQHVATGVKTTSSGIQLSSAYTSVIKPSIASAAQLGNAKNKSVVEQSNILISSSTVNSGSHNLSLQNNSFRFKSGMKNRKESKALDKVYPKPAYSYSCLIALALKNSASGSLPVSEIYNFMCEHFPYFRTAPNGWKNSVRHNLSLNKCFEKIEKPVSANGNQRKGCLWALNPNKAHKMDEEVQKWSKKDPKAITDAMSNPEFLGPLERGDHKFEVGSASSCSEDEDEEEETEFHPATTVLRPVKVHQIIQNPRIIHKSVLSDKNLSPTTVHITGSKAKFNKDINFLSAQISSSDDILSASEVPDITLQFYQMIKHPEKNDDSESDWDSISEAKPVINLGEQVQVEDNKEHSDIIDEVAHKDNISDKNVDNRKPDFMHFKTRSKELKKNKLKVLVKNSEIHSEDVTEPVYATVRKKSSSAKHILPKLNINKLHKLPQSPNYKEKPQAIGINNSAFEESDIEEKEVCAFNKNASVPSVNENNCIAHKLDSPVMQNCKINSRNQVELSDEPVFYSYENKASDLYCNNEWSPFAQPNEVFGEAPFGKNAVDVMNRILLHGCNLLSLPFAFVFLLMHHMLRFLLLSIMKPLFVDTAYIIIEYLIRPTLSSVVRPLLTSGMGVAVPTVDVCMVCVKPLTSVLSSCRLVDIKYSKESAIEVV